MTEFNPEKYGFKPTNIGADSVQYFYETDDFLLSFFVIDDFLQVCDTDDTVISEGKIPANNQSLALMLKAFRIERPKA